MSAPTTSDELLELVRKAGHANAATVTAFRKQCGRLPASASETAWLLVEAQILTPTQAFALMKDTPNGFRLGNYRLLRSLQSPGVGDWFASEQRMMRRPVTIMLSPAISARDMDSLEHFYREGRRVAAIGHPNHLHCYDIDQVGQTHFLVLEPFEAIMLAQVLRAAGGKLPVGEACGCIVQVASALHYRHEKGIVHRDLKPAGVMVSSEGVVKILDLRFLQVYDQNVLGAADYLSPEQALDSAPVDLRADIYSLGAIFYHLLTGRTLFEGGSVAQKLIWHLNREPAAIHTLRPEVPEQVCRIVSRMMAKKPDQRYHSADAVIAAVQPFVVAAPPGTCPPMAACANNSPHIRSRP